MAKDDDIDKDLPVEEPAVEAPEVEEPEVVEPEEPVEEPVEPVVEEEPAPQPSRRESLRIQQVIENAKNGAYSQPLQKPAGIDYGQALDADPAVIKQLDDDRKAVQQEAYDRGLEQAKTIQFHTRLEIDAPKVEAKYPQLNKESPEFNPAVANAINQWYVSTAGFQAGDRDKGIPDRVQNANVRYSDFVDGIFELGNEIAGEKNTSTAKNIAKQAATTALRPDGSATKRLNLNKTPEAMTDEELDAIIGQGLKR